MSDQYQLFDGYGRPTSTPRSHRRGGTLEMCAVSGCNNPRRRVRGAKYCEDHATSIGYRLTGNVPEPDVPGLCVVCSEPVRRQVRSFGTRAIWLCREHRHLRNVFKAWRRTYNVSDEQMRQLVTEAVCWVCEESVAWRFKPYGGGESAERIHVDHDHNCCKGEGSCGDCVRGLAHQSCNHDVGHVERLIRRVGPVRVVELVDHLRMAAEAVSSVGTPTAWGSTPRRPGTARPGPHFPAPGPCRCATRAARRSTPTPPRPATSPPPATCATTVTPHDDRR